MGDIVTFPADRHQAVQQLLPWYETGRLDPDERALVEAHLQDCGECRDDLGTEPELMAALAAESAGAGSGWNALETRLRSAPTPRPRSAGRRWTAPARALMRPERLKWVAAAQFAALALLGYAALPAPQPQRQGAYRALGDAPAARAGNVLAMFQPNASEADLRRALNASGARMVDGPTAAGAYVLLVPGGDGGAGLASLRHDPHVTMAEPIEEAPAE